MMTKICLILFFLIVSASSAQQTFIQNVTARDITELNGYWKIIIDPYENGFFNYRYQESPNGYFKNESPKTKSDLIEYDFDSSDSLLVPGDWNTQKESLFFYEGTVWYKKSFNFSPKKDKRIFINIGAANYNSVVYFNGDKVGSHTGGFTPFAFEVTDKIDEDENFAVIKVDNKRVRQGVPTLNTDWWNYGGITRDVYLVETPPTFIRDYFIQLKPYSTNIIEGWIQLDGVDLNKSVTLSIPELNINEIITPANNGLAKFSLKSNPVLWEPNNPYLYDISIRSLSDTVKDMIAFRSIKTNGTDILLNNKPIFLKGISIHEESPITHGRASSIEDALKTLEWVKELGCNFIRLAHYPHNENIIRQAEKMGILVWSEIPVYWTILWDNIETYRNAEHQLMEMISRDKNRANIIIWSVANETPRGEERLAFLTSLIIKAKELDPTRLVSAATELTYEGNVVTLDDPLCDYLDVIGANEYIGWYSRTAEEAQLLEWKSNFNKPLIISEFGGGALYGLHGDKETRWTEEFQENIYINQIAMLKNIPFLKGTTPWILFDFRSPRRPLPKIQDFYNRKGLISTEGNKKKAFYILKNFYEEN
jgi:beta-glucuronidase